MCLVCCRLLRNRYFFINYFAIIPAVLWCSCCAMRKWIKYRIELSFIGWIFLVFSRSQAPMLLCCWVYFCKMSWPWPWFIPHHRCIRPNVDDTNVCLELMFQPLPRLMPFFGGPSLPQLSSSSLVCQVFSWIPQLPSAALVSECVLHPLSWHDQAIASFFYKLIS